jgi:glycolate oxidase FAD binding subunit
MNDLAELITAKIATAKFTRTPLRIIGGNSKAHLGRAIVGTPLEVGGHSGIVSYEPKELVLTARAGTPIQTIESTLAEYDQLLGFEPPSFGGAATIGGTLATNISGPARPWRGSVRDAILGIRLINGMGQHLRFGGQVIKNVAGFDVSRLQAGSFGALGVITEVSLKVVPKPQAEVTLTQECNAITAIEQMNTLAGQPRPLSAAAWLDGTLYLRLSGNEQAVRATRKQWGGDILADGSSFWNALKEQKLPFFSRLPDTPLWRFSVKPTAPLGSTEKHWLIDWGGAQRFVQTQATLDELAGTAQAAGGYVMCLRQAVQLREFMQAPSAANKALHIQVKNSFDPKGVLNPGLLYSWL